MESCARRAGERRAHSNWRRLKEGWLKVRVNLSRSIPKGIKIWRHMSIQMTTAKSRLVSVPKSYLDSLEATKETLENEYVMNQLERSEIDIQMEKVRSVREFLKEL